MTAQLELTSRPCSRRRRSSSSFSAIFCLTLFFLRGGSATGSLGFSGSESSSSQSSYNRDSQMQGSVSRAFLHAARAVSPELTHLDFLLNVFVVEFLATSCGELRRRGNLLRLVVVFCA